MSILENSAWKPLLENLPVIRRTYNTPCYVYNECILAGRLAQLTRLFGERFEISYAVKANPNRLVLQSLANKVDTFDVSSYGEVERVLQTGFNPSKITFSGPAKRKLEIARAVHAGVGEIVIESENEAKTVSALCVETNRTQNVLLRINPTNLPKGFGASMSGRSSQFGIDQEQLADCLPAIGALPGINLNGFHIYSGTNCLDVEPLIENFEIMFKTFAAAKAINGTTPEKLIFGAGFGVPYTDKDQDLDIESLASAITTLAGDMKNEYGFGSAKLCLELGRWLVAPSGVLLTSVVDAKASRGTEIRLCDAGFNNHLAACGMMGSVIRRNWKFENLTSTSSSLHKYNLVGPLCTSIDLLAKQVELPTTSIDDVLAIRMSGAYGYSASPVNFISHPSPRELWLDENNRIQDGTEKLTNHWSMNRGQ